MQSVLLTAQPKDLARNVRRLIALALHQRVGLVYKIRIYLPICRRDRCNEGERQSVRKLTRILCPATQDARAARYVAAHELPVSQRFLQQGNGIRVVASRPPVGVAEELQQGSRSGKRSEWT